MPTIRASVICAIAGLASLTTGCGSKKVVATLREQKAGQVTYSCTGGSPVWSATGSAKYTKTVPLRQTFDRQPHFTYVVFRDKQRNEDHVVTFEAAGDLTVAQDAVEVKDEASLFRVIEVQPLQQSVSVSLRPKPVELIDLVSNKDEPRIIVSSDGKVRLKYPSMWSLDDTFGLDEVKAIKHTKGLSGSGTIRFVLVEKEYEVSFSGETAGQHYAELERIVKPMAPHIQLSSGRNWWLIALVIVLAIVAIAAIVAKAANK